MSMREVRPGVWKGEIWKEGRRKTITFHGSAKDAKAYEAEERLKVHRGRIVDTRTVPTFAAFCVDTYKPAAKTALRQKTWDVRRYQLENLIVFFGPTKLTKFREAQVEEYKQTRRKEVGAVTVNTELNVLSAVFTYAEQLKVACVRPKIVRYKVRRRKGKVRFFTREEVGFIFAACAEKAPKFLCLFTFLFETGCRKSESIHLPWTNVLLDQRMVRIWSETDEDEDDGDEDDDPYLVKSVEREIPLSDHLVRLLRELKVRGLSREWVFPVVVNRCHTKGEQYTEFPSNTWDRVLVRATELARQANPDARKIDGGPHKARHTFASHFLQAKPDLFLLGRVLGHSHGRVTELYSHLLPEHMAEARNVVTFGTARIDDDQGASTRSDDRSDGAQGASASDRPARRLAGD